MKRCSSCKQWLDEAEFNKNSSKSDGLQSRCRECQWTINYWTSLDAPLPNHPDMTLYDVVTEPRREQDETFDKVLRALWYWINDKTLTKKQAAAILLHIVDRLGFNEIGRLAGISGVTVRKSYDGGIHKLRKRYGESQQVHAYKTDLDDKGA